MVSEDEIKKAFKAMDKDGNGYIDLTELKECLKACSVDATDDNIKLIYDAMDTNKDGKITLDEFIQIANGI